MAQKRIERNDLIADDALTSIIKEGTQLVGVLKNILSTSQEMLKSNPLKDTDDIKNYRKEIEAVNATTSSLKSTQEAVTKATKDFDKALAAEVAVSKEVTKQLDDINGSLVQNIKLQTERSLRIKEIREEQKKLTNLYKIGGLTQSRYVNGTAQLNKESKELTVANQKLGFTIRAQIKEGQAAATSFDQQAQRLGQLRSAYRKLNKEERESSQVGGVLLKNIKALDAQVKENDASIGNFQRNVGNYNDTVLQSIEGTNLFGVSLSQLASPMGLVAAGATALVGLYSKSTSGSYDLITASNKLSGALTTVGNSFAEALGADGKGDGLFARLATGLNLSFFGLAATLNGEVQAIALNALAELEVAEVKADIANQKGLKRIEELKQARDDQELSNQERLKAGIEVLDVLKNKEDEELKVVQQQVEAAKALLATDLNNLDYQKQVAQFELEEASIKRKNEQIITESKRVNSRLSKEIADEFIKSKEDQTKAQKKLNDEIRKAELEGDEDFSDEANADIEREIKILKGKREAREKADAQGEKDLDDLLARDQKAKDDAATEDTKREKKKNDELIAQRKKLVDDAIQSSQIIANALDQASDRKVANLDFEIDQTAKSIDRQTTLAANGLDNQLAFEEKKAAELERKRQQEAKKQEKRQKVLAYLAQFTELSKDEPNTAAIKAVANVAVAETISGLFYEGTEKVEDDVAGKPFFAGRDGYVIRVDGSERIMTGAQNTKIGGMSNDDLANLAESYQRGTIMSTSLNDTRIVNELKGIQKKVQELSTEINISPDFVSRTELRNGLKKVSIQKPRRF